MNPATARRLDRARRIPRQHIKLYPGGRFWVKSQATAKNVGYVGQLKWKGSKVVAAGCSCPDCQKGLDEPDDDGYVPVLRGMRLCKHWGAAALWTPYTVIPEAPSG